MNLKKFIHNSLLLCIAPLVIICIYSACPQYAGLGAGIDIVPPKGKIIYPDAGETPIRGSFVIKGEAEDDGSIKSVSVQLENIDTKVKTAGFNAEVVKISTNTAAWKVFIPNERKPKPADDPHPLTAEYPISDGEYTAIVTVTDNTGKETRLTKNFKIDNTPPVFIVSRPSTVTKPEDGSDPAIIDTYGAVFSVAAQAGEKNIVEELRIKRTDNQDTVIARFIGKNINATFSSTTADYEKLRNTDGSPVRTQLFLADNARTYNDTSDTGSGNESEWYYLRNDIYFDVLSKGYTPEIISDYFAGKRGSGTDTHSIKLNELWSDSPEAVTARGILKAKRIMTPSITPPPANLRRSVFKLNPTKSPGFSIPNIRNISDSATAAGLSSVDSIYWDSNGERVIKVDLRPNRDGNPLFTGTSANDYKNSKIRIYLYKPAGDTDEEKWEALKNPVLDGTGKNIDTERLFDFADITDTNLAQLIKVDNGIVTVTCKINRILDAGIYQLVLKKAPDSPAGEEGDATDTDRNPFAAYNPADESFGGKVVVKLTYVGEEPRIFPKQIGEDQKYKNADFTVEADLVNGGPAELTGTSENKKRTFQYRVYKIVDTHEQEITGSTWKNLDFVSGAEPHKRSRWQASIAMDDLKTAGIFHDGEYKIKFKVKTAIGREDTASLHFMLDKSAPKPSINFPEADNPQAGKIPVSGQISDYDGAGVKPEGTKYLIGKQSGTVTPATAGWKPMQTSTAASWSFDTDLDVMKDHPENFGDQVSGSANLYDIPVYILTEDKIGNKGVKTLSIRFDKDGTTPTVQIISPAENATLGGAVYMFGTAKTSKSGPAGIKKVYIQFSKNSTFNNGNCTINGVDWWIGGEGKEITFNQNSGWDITINGDGKFNPSGTGSWDIYFRLRAQNQTDQWGDWTAARKITIDKDSPQITGIKLIDESQSFGAPGDNFVSNMWIRRGKKLAAALEDDSGIKSVSIKSTEFNMNYTHDNAPTGWLTAVPLAADPAKKNYNLTIPFNLDTLSAEVKKKGEFKVEVAIVDNGTPSRSTSRTFNFRFDITNPAGDFGEFRYIHSANFTNANSITDTALADKIRAEAPSGNYDDVNLLIGNTPVKITSVSAATIGFSPAIEPGVYNYILYKKNRLIYNYNGSWIVNGVANDTGSSIEKVEAWVQVGTVETKHCIITESDSANRISRQLGDQVTWKGTLNLERTKDNTPFPDGKGSLHYKITDKSGNSYTGKEDGIIVKNKPLLIKKLVFMTDLSGNGTYENTEKFTIGGLDGLNADRDFRATADVASYFTFKNPAMSALEVTLSGGSGAAAKVSLLSGNINGTSIISEDGTITNGDYTVTLDLSNKFDNMGADDSEKKLFLKVTDESVNIPSGTPPWHAQADITVGLDVKDEVRPRGVILPFFYNSDKIELVGVAEQKLSSVKYESEKPAGHIELAPVKKSDGNLYWAGNSYPSVSGKVILRGIAYDNIRLKKLELSGAEIGGVSNEFTNTGWSSSSALKIVKNNLSNTGHYVEWEYVWNTGTPAKAQTVTLNVTDAADKINGSTPPPHAEAAIPNAEPGIKTGTRDQTDIDLTLDPADKAVKYQFIRLTDENERHYLVQIKEVKENNKVSWFSADVPQNINKYALYTSETNNAQITVNIVPYVTKIETALSKLGGANDPDLYARTALGHYPVQDKETIKIHGFNLTGASVTVGGKATNSLSGSSSPWSLNFTNDSATPIDESKVESGALELTVNGVSAINNLTDNTKPYNKAKKTANNDKLTDDIHLDVWEFNSEAAKPERGIITEPVMRINPSNGMIGFAFVNGPDYFSMSNGTSNSYTKWQRNYDDYGNVDFVYDSEGRSHGVAVGRDINSGGNHAGKFTYFTSKWGTGNTSSQGANYSGGNGLRLEAIGQKGTMESATSGYILDKTRIQHPSLATVSKPGMIHSGKPRLYLAYYDAVNDQIRFKYGTNDKTSNWGFGQFIDQESANAVTAYNQANVGIVAGKYKNSFGIADTGNTTGTYLSLGVVSGSSAAADTAVLIWFDETSQKLKYTYKKDPQNGDHASQSGDGDGNWKTPVDVFDKTNVGEYCKIAVDKAGGIHIAAFDSDTADLKYAYLSSYSDTVFKRSTVDSYGITGTYISLDVAYTPGTNGKPVPYIGYYSASAGRSKLAYLADISGAAGSAQGIDGSGYFTGKWEVSLVPTASRVRQDNINVGVWKGNTAADYGVIKASVSGTNSSDTENGTVHGNGTANPVLAYAVKKAMNGYIETAQKK